MYRAALKSLLGRKVRLFMSTFAVVLGVAFVAGTLVFTDTLNRSFTSLFASSVGDVVVEPAERVAMPAGGPGGRSGDGDGLAARSLPGSLVKDLAGLPGVARVDGNVLDTAVFVVDAQGKVLGTVGTALASNWTGAPAGHGIVGLQVVQGREPAGRDEVVMDASTARRAGHGVGSEVRLVTSTVAEVLEVRVVGIADFAEGGSFSGATWVAFDTATAQDLFMDGRDRFTSLWVTAEPGVSQEQLRDTVSAALPPGLQARTGDDAAEESASQLLNALSFLTTFLLIFAGISLVVGAFLIVNTFSILLAQRSRELALLRALGASRRQVTVSVQLEAFVLGLVGSVLGFLLGIAMAMAIRALFATFGLDLSGQPMVLRPRTFVVSFLVGVGVTMAAAWTPARRSARIAPVQAMRDDVALPESSMRTRFGAGLGLVALGLVLLFLGSGERGNAGWYLGAGVLAVLLGVAAAAPVLSRPFLLLAREFFGRLFGMVGRLAGQNSLRNPRRTTATASALMIGLALACTMAILGDSAKASVDQALEENFRGDYVVSNAVGQPFSTKVAARIARIDGVADVVAQRWAFAENDGAPVGVVAVDPADLTGLLDVTLLEGRVGALDRGTVLVSRTRAEDSDLSVGDPWDLTFDGRRTEVRVVGIFEDNAVLTFGVVTTPDTLTGVGIPARDSLLVVDVDEPGTPLQSAVQSVVSDLPTVTVKDQAAYAAEQREPIDRMVTMIFALLGLALLIAVLGIVNTLALSVVERTREIGLLRAIGLSRRQTRRMVTVESVVIAALGASLGVCLGIGFGVVLMRALRDEGLEVVSVPWEQLGVFVVVSLVVGVLAAVLPARRASRLDVLDAISTD